LKSRFFFAVSWTALAIGFSQEPTIAPSDRYAWLRKKPDSSLAHFRMAEKYFSEHDHKSAASEFREALNGDHDVSWTEIWSHINLGKIFDVTGQCVSAKNEYLRALESNDNTRGALDEASAYLRSNVIAPFSMQPEIPDDLRAAMMQAPYPYHKTPPEYSDEARLAGLEGMVILHGVVAEDGSARDLKVSQSLGLGLDEKAIEAVNGWRYLPGSLEGTPVPAPVKIEVEFRLLSKNSRWHLIRLEFQPGANTVRPVFLRADYPAGAGVRRDSIDDARLVAIMGRYATTTLSFDVNEHGTPVNFVVLGASREVWGQEAIGIVRKWRFRPGMKDGIAVSVPCQIDIVWGSRTLVSHPQLEFGDVSQVATNTFVDGCRTAR
jgi:TonB family protein